jgi:hypothetical protein
MARVSLVKERKAKGKPWRIWMFECRKCGAKHEFTKPRSVYSLVTDGHAVVTSDGKTHKDRDFVQHIVCSACVAHEESMFQGVH